MTPRTPAAASCPSFATRHRTTSFDSMRNIARIFSRSPTIPAAPTTNAPPITIAPMACATGRPSATPSSSPTGFTRSHPKPCSPLRPSTTSINPTTIRALPTCPSPQPGIRTPTTSAARQMPTTRSAPTASQPASTTFYQSEKDLFGTIINDGSAPSQPEHAIQRRCSALRVLSCRPSAPRPLHHAARRRALLHLPRRNRRNRHLSPHRRHRRNSPAPLGSPRLLRTLLPARADPDRLLFRTQLRRQSSWRRKHLHASALRARRRTSIRHPDSLAWLDARRGHLQEPHQQFPRSLQPRRIQHVLPHRRRWCAGPRLGDDPALARTCASRPLLRHLLQPDRRAARQHHRRIHLHRPQ